MRFGSQPAHQRKPLRRRKLVHLRRLVPGCAVLVLLLAASPTQAQSIDPSLQGRVFQSSDGALWVYKDGNKYPLLGVDLSDQQIDAIPAMVDQPVAHLDQLFASESSPPPVAAPPAPPVIDVGNPHAYDRIPAGLDMRGVAYDPLANGGTGIDRVQVFMGDRAKGGVYVGDAVLGGSITNGWEVVVNLPAGPHMLFVYARSAITGQEAVVTIPVEVVS
jgi:hypothetical protein